MTIYFRCKQSGNLVGFNDEVDITTMRKEEHYEEVTDSVADAKVQAAPALQLIDQKRRGRPKKEPAADTRSSSDGELTI